LVGKSDTRPKYGMTVITWSQGNMLQGLEISELAVIGSCDAGEESASHNME
jgi:hypothetical protein